MKNAFGITGAAAINNTVFNATGVRSWSLPVTLDELFTESTL